MTETVTITDADIAKDIRLQQQIAAQLRAQQEACQHSYKLSTAYAGPNESAMICSYAVRCRICDKPTILKPAAVRRLIAAAQGKVG